MGGGVMRWVLLLMVAAILGACARRQAKDLLLSNEVTEIGISMQDGRECVYRDADLIRSLQGALRRHQAAWTGAPLTPPKGALLVLDFKGDGKRLAFLHVYAESVYCRSMSDEVFNAVTEISPAEREIFLKSSCPGGAR
jgi:hypothetical protein